MTLEEMERETSERIEKIIGAFNDPPAQPTGQTRVIVGVYREAYKDIQQLIKDFYLDNLTGVAPEQYYTESIKKDTLEPLQKEINKIYAAAAQKAGRLQVESSSTAITNQYYGNMYSVDQFAQSIDKDYFTPLDAAIVAVSVYGTTKIIKELIGDKTKKELAALTPYLPKHGSLPKTLNSNKVKDMVRIQEIIEQALRNGDSIPQISKKLRETFNITANKSVQIARTEATRNMNSGAYAQSVAAKEAGIDLKRMAVETKDTRTRPQSVSIDGQKVEVEEPFLYPGGLPVMIIGNSGVAEYDINERGTQTDIIEGFEPEVISVRNQETGKTEIVSYRKAPQWMEENNLKFNKSGKMVSK